MALASGRARQRAWKPKNRTGCKTCKIRKIKCDEEKPSCKKCTSTGRKCDGYDSSFSPAFKPPPTNPPISSARSKLHPKTGQALVRSISPISIAPALILSTTQERDSFEFFTTRAASSLSGFVDSPFWQREILQAAHQHESIKNCIVALGAMHRRFFEGHKSNLDEVDVADKWLQFALQKSNQAIQGLLKEAGPKGKTAALDRVTLMTCCILFSNMACLQGHQREGLQHLKSGIRMLNEMDKEQQPRFDSHAVDVESLRSIFIGLDMQARSIMSPKDIESWEPMPRTKEAVMPHDGELSTASILALQRYLQSFLNHLLVFFQGSVHRPVDEREAVHEEFRRLNSRFDHGTIMLNKIVAMASQKNGGFNQSLIALQLLHHQVEFILRGPRPAVGGKFHLTSDSFSTSFDPAGHLVRMLDLCSQLLRHTAPLAPVFTTSAGPLSALWLVATRAPSECIALRKRAMRLMLSYPRREGFWDGLMAGQIAQEVLRLEQESTQEELGLSVMPTRDLIIPEDLRIIVVALSYDEDDDRKATVVYKTMREVFQDRPGRTQWLHW